MKGGKVVSNSGPLMALAKLNQLSILKKLFQKVLIPQAVYEEAVIRGMTQGYPDALAIKFFLEQQGWQPVYVDRKDINKDLLKEKLDWGEVESLQLAMNVKAAIFLVDDEEAREVARKHGLSTKGTVGILVDAFQKSLIDLEEIELLFTQIQARDDIWISTTLCQKVLSELKARELN
jgi:predicted nucleic acid-binding protein